MKTIRTAVLIVWGCLAATSEAVPWTGRTEVTTTRDAVTGGARFEAGPIRTAGGGYRYRLIAVKTERGELSVELALETFANSAQPVGPWSAVRDITSRDRLPILRTETDAAGVQITVIGLSADYLTRMLESRERSRWVLESADARDELEIPKGYVRALPQKTRAAERSQPMARVS